MAFRLSPLGGRLLRCLTAPPLVKYDHQGAYSAGRSSGSNISRIFAR